MSETSQTLLRHILEAKYPEESKHSSFSPAQLAITESSIDRENFEKLKTAYDACMDEDTIKKVGATPLLDVFEQTLNITELSGVITYLAQQGISAFVSSGAGADDTNPDVVVVQVSSPWSIGLPSKDYYKNDDIVAKYQSAIGQVFEALNNEAQKQGRPLNFNTATSEGVLNLEKKLAAASPDAEDRDDVTVSLSHYNTRTGSDISLEILQPHDT
jgi:endothelin-converting enzyme